MYIQFLYGTWTTFVRDNNTIVSAFLAFISFSQWNKYPMIDWDPMGSDTYTLNAFAGASETVPPWWPCLLAPDHDKPKRKAFVCDCWLGKAISSYYHHLAIWSLGQVVVYVVSDSDSWSMQGVFQIRHRSRVYVSSLAAWSAKNSAPRCKRCDSGNAGTDFW